MQAQKIYISKIAEYQIQETTHYFKPAPPFNKIEVWYAIAASIARKYKHSKIPWTETQSGWLQNLFVKANSGFFYFCSRIQCLDLMPPRRLPHLVYSILSHTTVTGSLTQSVHSEYQIHIYTNPIYHHLIHNLICLGKYFIFLNVVSKPAFTVFSGSFQSSISFYLGTPLILLPLTLNPSPGFKHQEWKQEGFIVKGPKTE